MRDGAALLELLGLPESEAETLGLRVTLLVLGCELALALRVALSDLGCTLALALALTLFSPSPSMYTAPLLPWALLAPNTTLPLLSMAGEERMGPRAPLNTHTCVPLLALKARTHPSSPAVYR